ncbi:MAG: hypothetical protein ACYC0F_04300 [Rhodanobacter sp.]
MSYTFNAQDQLASFTDGNSHATTQGSYKRGRPQTIGYPDGTSQKLVVDDFGQTGDEVAWLPTTFTYTYVTSAERGLPANHWRRTTTTGGTVAVTYFDVMLRPVLQKIFRLPRVQYRSME